MWTQKTCWYGIYVTFDNGHYWIVDDNGGEEYCGRQYPSDAQLNSYRNEAIA